MSEKRTRKNRGKGFGTVEKRGSNWLGRWTVNGTRHNQKIHASTKDEARRILDEITSPFRLKNERERNAALIARQETIDERLAEIEDAKPALLLQDAFEAYVKSPSRPKTAGSATLRINENWMRKLVSFISRRHPDVREVEVRHVTREDAVEFLSVGYPEAGSAVKNQALSFFKRLWRVLMDDEGARIKTNPWEKFRNEKVTRHRHENLSADELRKLYSVLEGEERLWFTVQLYTMQRTGDCALLKWDQVDLAHGRILFRQMKTGAKVNVPICAPLMAALSEIPVEGRSGYVTPRMAGLYLKSSSFISHLFKRACRKVGIETDAEVVGTNRRVCRIGTHSLRHSGISFAANGGVNAEYIKRVSGHASDEMLDVYVHDDDTALQSVVSAIPDITGKAMEQAPSSRLSEVLRLVNELTDEEKAVVLQSLQPRQKVSLEILDVNVKAA